MVILLSREFGSSQPLTEKDSRKYKANGRDHTRHEERQPPLNQWPEGMPQLFLQGKPCIYRHDTLLHILEEVDRPFRQCGREEDQSDPQRNRVGKDGNGESDRRDEFHALILKSNEQKKHRHKCRSLFF